MIFREWLLNNDSWYFPKYVSIEPIHPGLAVAPETSVDVNVGCAAKSGRGARHPAAGVLDALGLEAGIHNPRMRSAGLGETANQH